MREMIRRTRYACIACHDFKDGGCGVMNTRQTILEFLRGSGFSITTRDNDPRPFVRDHIHGQNTRWQG